MTEQKAIRLSKLASEFNVGISTIVDFLRKKGFEIDPNPNTKLAPEEVALISKEYSSDLDVKKASERIDLPHTKREQEEEKIAQVEISESEEEFKREVLIKDNNATNKMSFLSDSVKVEPEIKIVGNIDLSAFSRPKVSSKPVEPVSAPVQQPVMKPEPVIEKVPDEPVAEKKEPLSPEADPEISVAEVPVAEIPVAKEIPLVASAPVVEKSDDNGENKSIENPMTKQEVLVEKEVEKGPKIVGRVNLEDFTRPKKPFTRPDRKSQNTPQEKVIPQAVTEKPVPKATSEIITPVVEDQSVPSIEKEIDFLSLPTTRLASPVIVGRIELKDPKKSSGNGTVDENDRKKKRKRIRKDKVATSDKSNAPVTPVASPDKKKEKAPAPVTSDASKAKKKVKKPVRQEVNEEDVQKQIKDTLARLTLKGSKSKTSRHRRDKRDAFSQKLQEEEEQNMLDQKILKVTEFVSVNELAYLMGVSVTDVISTCMSMGLFVSINQRLDAETMVLVADEFNYEVQFVTADIQEAIQEEPDDPKNLTFRPPVVAVMGHVDHGKTKLLDYIRKSNVISGEAGGITQHIGAYGVTLNDGRQITFLDTPGHEAFTAMRARGAKITDVVIIVVAADDGVKQQTIEAINHASAAGVSIVFAINKIDKPEANPEKVKDELAQMNYLVEEWGGKYQSQEVSAKSGLNVDLLLEKVLLEAELLELKADPKKRAHGTIIESSLDKGRGYVATVLVQGGTLNQGDIVLAGNYTGSVKAMYNERGQKVDARGPSSPVLILGLDGAPQAGDLFHVMTDFKEARDIANRRSQLQREQGIRTKKHITLDEIGRRIAIGNFQELNLIIKGDVDGSIEALSDSLIKLSTGEIEVNVIHKAVGEISESDVLLAAASNAIIVGFQVRPSLNARRLAEREQIDIRLYSIIYKAIEEIKAAMEGMLSPEIKEEIVATLEIRDVFKITRVGSVAGCFVREGKITRNTKVRLIREGIVVFTGELASLKRFKDDVKEVAAGYECGLNLLNYNDLEPGDTIEGYQEVEVRKKL
ncbi:MAG: translation initiation factor IF-2 [Bacteroidales bacterium]|nr:translation initiation factor IF-2 [Bacteroidales bacterium]